MIIWKSSSWKSRLLALGTVLLAVAMIIKAVTGVGDSSTETATVVTQGRAYMDPDSHKRSNPFAPEGHVSYMEGVLEVKRIGGNSQKNDDWKVCKDCGGVPIGGGKQQQRHHDDDQSQQQREQPGQKNEQHQNQQQQHQQNLQLANPEKIIMDETTAPIDIVTTDATVNSNNNLRANVNAKRTIGDQKEPQTQTKNIP